jgi:hypothetical protein
LGREQRRDGAVQGGRALARQRRAALSASSGNSTASSLLLNASATHETARDKISLGGLINAKFDAM